MVKRYFLFTKSYNIAEIAPTSNNKIDWKISILLVKKRTVVRTKFIILIGVILGDIF